MDDTLALEALLELSQHINGRNPIQSQSQEFPLLDKSIVQAAVEGIVFIIEKKHKLKNKCISLTKKWCSLGESGFSDKHLAWIGSGCGHLVTIECLLSVCTALLDSKSLMKNWQLLEMHQQQALCLAMICLTDECENAKSLSIQLFEFVICDPALIKDQQIFIDKVWDKRGLLGLTTKQMEKLVKNSPHRLEKQLLDLARQCLGYNQHLFWQTAEENSLIKTCSSSPVIFQIATSILMHLVLKSLAHQSIINLLNEFVSECAPNELQILKLFPANCHVALALLSVHPEATDLEVYVDYVVSALTELHPATAKLLLVLNVEWIPLLKDKIEFS